MTKDIYHLSYVSTAKDCLRYEDFEKILASANKNNNEMNITGILVYCNNQFFQILEGRKEDVLSIYDDILVDCRHDNLIKLQEGFSEKRQFQRWEMAFKSYNQELQQLDNFNNEEFYSYLKDQLDVCKQPVSLKILADFFDLNGNAHLVPEKHL